jgi:hypothetical protein
VIDPEDPVVARRNMVLGWAMFGFCLLLFAGTVGVAFIYLAFD